MSSPQPPGAWSDPTGPGPASPPPGSPAGNPYAAPADPFATPQSPYATPENPYAAPQSPYATPENPYAAPQSPYATPQNPPPAPVAGPYAVPPAGYQQPYPQYGYPMVPVAPATNGLAIASMILSIVGVAGLCAYGLGGFFGLPGAILGHVARRRIRERGESGDGMALAGIILGWIATTIFLLAVIGFVIFFVWVANQESYDYDSNNLDMLRGLGLWLRSLAASVPVLSTGSTA